MVFHWPPSELWELDLEDISRWHHLAKLRVGVAQHG
ncbi:GpE family phage tail protein [Paraneptunicella aestuarii]|nr:GpE family phage tail protein [Paraneptunicella aestuarii]